jgi:hypothetical protein
MSITINKINSQSDLFCHYDRQTSAQGCYVELDCKNETLSALYNAEIGNAIPFSVYHGHDQRFAIPLLTVDAANRLMDEIKPLAERVVGGYKSEWNGNNHVAVFTDDAQAAIEEITEICDNIENDETNSVSEWDSGDWLQHVMHRHDADGEQCQWNQAITVEIDGYGTITAKTTDDKLLEMQQAIENDLDEKTILNNLKKFLIEERDNCINNTPTEEA